MEGLCFAPEAGLPRSRGLKGRAGVGGRRQREFIAAEKKDASYWEKRRKNNEAAKRSREKRRCQDLALETRVLALHEENTRLRAELLQLKLRFGLLGAAAFVEQSRQLGRRRGSGMGADATYDPHAPTPSSDDSSETESRPRGSLSDMSDGSSRDSPVPQTWGEAQAASRARGPPEISPGSGPRSVILFGASGPPPAPPRAIEMEEDEAYGPYTPGCCSDEAYHAASTPAALPEACGAPLLPVVAGYPSHPAGFLVEEGAGGYSSEEDPGWGGPPAGGDSPPDVKMAALPHKLRLKGRAHSSGAQEPALPTPLLLLPLPQPPSAAAVPGVQASGGGGAAPPAWEGERPEEMAALVRQALLRHGQPSGAGALERLLCRGPPPGDVAGGWGDGARPT
ncbi:nuclear factor interleukin-3-regulated protein-like [Alligator sinensis]|uniref:Nuclear factor interleukin-3-regulated protein-like n=1 Tax=Alligator sinensis TaxID=38654 RepID=A0A1U8D217_ALLSI|nr:nuclear factor interleukin-3-regulated protein-like [Alligator sinensis]